MADRSVSEWRALTAIAVPVVLVDLGMMLMGVVDTIMVGHLSPNALASVALGNVYFFHSVVIPMGTLMALDPLVSQAYGAGDETAMRRAIQRAVLIAVVMGALASMLALPAEGLLRLFSQPAGIIEATTDYIQISAAGVVPFLLFLVLRLSLQARHRVAPIVSTIIVANLVNAGLNWVLVFGRLGAPAMGVAGSAVATVISRWMLLAMLLALSWKELRPYLASPDPESWTFAPIRRMLALGLPIGLQQFLEFSAFGTVGLLMGAFGAVQVAAHQVALSAAALTFMVPIGVATAGAVRVGHAIGAGDAPRSRLAAKIAYTLGGGFMTLTAVAFLLFPEQVASIYTDDVALIAITASLIPVAGVFQVFDGLQAVGAGILRGLGDTTVPLIGMLSAYWVIGIPASLWFAYRTGLGPQGLWWGFVAGLSSVSLFLLWRVVTLMRRGVRRVQVEAAAPIA